MDEKALRAELIDEYRSYLEIISQRGLSFPEYGDEALKETFSLADLRHVVTRIKELARTPS